MTPAPLFWLIALLLVAATVAMLVWPLLRGRPARPPEEDGAPTDVYRDQKRQLDGELAAGAITRAERDAQLDELAARLGAELASGTAPVRHISPRSSYVAALILVAAVPVSAILLYAVFTSSGPLRVAAQAGEQPPVSHDEIAAMVDKLAIRMKAHPEDPAGWQLLARAYASMGRFQESTAAFNEAAARAPADATLLADWADALAMQNQSLQGEPSRLIGRALTLDPKNPKALSLSATAALERKDYDGAIAQWRKLKAEFPPDGEQAREIDAMIAEADGARRGAPVAADVPPASTANAAPAAAGASAPGMATTAAAANASAVTGRVSLDPKLRERAAANDALFIFARAVNGPRMPLAVVRASAGELPRDFKLDDSMAMTPNARLSETHEVIVEARISKSGSATPSPGDLRGTSAPVKPGTRDVLIVINDTVP